MLLETSPRHLQQTVEIIKLGYLTLQDGKVMLSLKEFIPNS